MAKHQKSVPAKGRDPRRSQSNTTASEKPAAVGGSALPFVFSPLQRWNVLGGILLFVLFLYLPALFNDFTNWDDGGYVVDNKHIALTLEHFKLFFTENVLGNIHPLTMLSLSIDHLFGGTTNALPYHLTNVLWHVLNTGLVFWFAFRLSRENTWVAIITALFFGIHPMHVESVAWISARKDVLYTAFFMAGLIGWLSYIERPRWWIYLLIFASAALSGMAKPAAVVFPVVLLLLDYYRGRSFTDWKLWAEKVPFFILSVIVGLITLGAQEQAMHHDEYSWGEKIVVGMYGYVTYFIKAFWWGKMSPFYPYPEDKFVLPTYFYGYIPVFLAIVGATLWSLRKTRTIFWGMAFYTVTIALVLKVVTVGAAILAERYTYIPYIGIFFIVGSGYARLQSVRMRQFATVLLSLFALACTYKTWKQIRVWQDTVTLFTQAIDHFPKANLPYINRAGELRTRKQYEAALRDYDMADKVEPNYMLGIKGRALCLFDMKRYGDALRDFETLIKNGSQEAIVYGKHGACLTYLGRFEEAMPSYDKGIELDPQDGNIYNDRASNFFNLKSYDKAIDDYTKSIELKKEENTMDMLRNRGATLLMMGRYEESIRDFDACIAKGNEPAVIHYYRSAALLKLGKKEDALAAARLSVTRGHQLPEGYAKQVGLE